MTTNKAADQWSVELERPSEHDGSPKPIRAMAANKADPEKTAETWWGLDATQLFLISVVGAAADHVDWYLHQLEDHRYAQLGANLNASELVRMGFSPDDLEV